MFFSFKPFPVAPGSFPPCPASITIILPFECLRFDVFTTGAATAKVSSSILLFCGEIFSFDFFELIFVFYFYLKRQD